MHYEKPGLVSLNDALYISAICSSNGNSDTARCANGNSDGPGEYCHNGNGNQGGQYSYCHNGNNNTHGAYCNGGNANLQSRDPGHGHHH